jgi:DNA phosphorothioation-dependent restriction protein DptF
MVATNPVQLTMTVLSLILRLIQSLLSFLELVSKINDGYRPNKHDKNTIVILEEIVDDVIKVVIRSNKLMLSDGRQHVYLTNEIEDSEIVVGGVE